MSGHCLLHAQAAAPCSARYPAPSCCAHTRQLCLRALPLAHGLLNAKTAAPCPMHPQPAALPLPQLPQHGAPQRPCLHCAALPQPAEAGRRPRRRHPPLAGVHCICRMRLSRVHACMRARMHALAARSEGMHACMQSHPCMQPHACARQHLPWALTSTHTQPLQYSWDASHDTSPWGHRWNCAPEVSSGAAASRPGLGTRAEGSRG